jgi:CubicO group peptidase (beta-lactamase class C family)
MADVEDVSPLRKQFTGAAVLLLAEGGRLSVDDDIRKYFPELASFKWRITVRQLLNYTSGPARMGEIADVVYEQRL